METHDIKIGSRTYFWHPVRLRWNTPFLHTAVTNETDEPYRRADSRVFHLWPTTLGAVFGKWQETGRDEDEALWEAIQGVTRWDEPMRLEENAAGPSLAVEREIEPITASVITKGKKQKTVIIHAPKWSEITLELIHNLPRARRDENVVKIGKHRYRLHEESFHRQTRYAERIDRRSLGQFLFGGAPK